MNDAIMVSACLMGEKVRYDGKVVPVHELFQRLADTGRVLPFCPEVDGGLPVPRVPAEIQGGDGFDVLAGRSSIVTRDGTDVTAPFRDGAAGALAAALTHGVRIAILKDGSPSCGNSYVYDGSFSKSRVKGKGIATALLEEHGIHVFSEGQIADIVEEILCGRMP
jgi:uncharacterized protein YbbK (DUF523 family)